ncbi:hypothetical protein V7S43_015950 [Phytophthora oleae]|uniref:Uncharacterized protein n=1 Tax=Phytophthora oleae TaxID=2107226 RepID=A0ABD3F0E1_9STRA
MECFGDLIDEERVAPETINDMKVARVDEELERWEKTATSILMKANRPETFLEFWKRQADSGTYKFLPQVARSLPSLLHPRRLSVISARLGSW